MKKRRYIGSISKLCLYCMLFIANPIFAATNSTWDWNDFSSYKDFDGNSILSPFIKGESFGVNIYNESHTVANGWRVYVKKLECLDYNDVCSTGSISRRYKYPIFALYNIYTGVLRTFIYLNDENFTGNKQLFLRTEIDNNSDIGLFLNNGEIATPLANKNRAFNEQSNVTVAPAYYDKWFVFDKLISYDPSLPKDELSFIYYLDAYAESEVNLEGKMELTLSNIQTPGSRSGFDSVLSGANTLIKAGNTINEGFGTIENTASKLQDRGNVLKSKTGPGSATLNSLGDNLLSLSSVLSGPTGSYFGAALGAANVISSFTNASGASTQMQFFSGSITLGGTIANQYPLEFISVGVHNSFHKFSVNNDDLKFPGNLGLFSLSRAPRLQVGYDHIALLDNILSLVEINPYSEMKLTELKIKPILTMTKTVSEENCLKACHAPGLFPWASPTYEIKPTTMVHTKLSPEGDRYEYTAELSTRGMVDISSKNLNINWEPFENTVDGQTSWSTLESAQLKFYFRFEHETDPNIFIEFVRIFPAEIVRVNCAFTPFTWNGEYTTICPSEAALKNIETPLPLHAGSFLLDTDNDGLSDGEEVRLGTNPHLADSDYDGIPDRYEVKIPNLNPLDASDALLDFDNDGYSNVDEYLVNSNPNDSRSTPETQRVASLMIPVISFLLN